MRTATSVAILVAAASGGVCHAAEPRTAAAVLAADDGWGAAETRGDWRHVARLLAPGYISIGADGRVTAREAIVDHARSSGADPARMAAEVRAWKDAHPSRGDVLLAGDLAVVRWTSTAGAHIVYSTDTFAYRHGRWRAVFSQHSTAG